MAQLREASVQLSGTLEVLATLTMKMVRAVDHLRIREEQMQQRHRQQQNMLQMLQTEVTQRQQQQQQQQQQQRDRTTSTPPTPDAFVIPDGSDMGEVDSTVQLCDVCHQVH